MSRFIFPAVFCVQLKCCISYLMLQSCYRCE